MTVRFSRLRIAGFKSFAEPVEIELLPGLTGIVGPNGCGKSNLLDALRFIMGETSSRVMHGTETEALIFAGTALRPAQNVAEVTLTLEAEADDLSAPLRSGGTVLFSREIARGRGSAFRINGHEARARDIQVVFASLGSGARSSLLIGQNQVAQLIAQRPEARRVLLEEAAGIAGMEARRREAELKLAASEANLVRSEEVKEELARQAATLGRQARQAKRYRVLTDTIQAAEGELLAMARARAVGRWTERKDALEAARASAAAATEAARRAQMAVADSEAAVSRLRTREQSDRGALERARNTLERIQEEETRNRGGLTDLTSRLTDLERDLARTESLATDATAALERLDAEREALSHSLEDQPSRLVAAKAGLAAASAACAEAATDEERAARASTTLELEVASLEDEERRAKERIARLEAESDRLVAECTEAQQPATEEMARAEGADACARSELTLRRSECARLEGKRSGAISAHEVARQRFSEADAECARIRAEIEALAAILAPSPEEEPGALLAGLLVPEGFEAALAAALGVELTSATGSWRPLSPLPRSPSLPEGSNALSRFIDAPRVLERALSRVGLIENAQDAPGLQERLAPGQSLVSRDGGLWRWDGYIVRPGAANVAGVRLRQRNHLDALRKQLVLAEEEADRARTERDRLAEGERRLSAETQAAVAACAAAGRHYEECHAAVRTREREADRATLRLKIAEERSAQIARDHAGAAATLVGVAQRRAHLADPEAIKSVLARSREALARAQVKKAAAERALAALDAGFASLTGRNEALIRERKEWFARAHDANEHRDRLQVRQSEWTRERDGLALRLQTLAVEQERAQRVWEKAKAAYQETMQELARVEKVRGQAEESHQDAERAAGKAQEARIACEVSFGQAETALREIEARVREQWGDAPALPEVAFDGSAEEALRTRLSHLRRQRESLGAVNLRAEAEVGELEERVRALGREEEELRGAIGKLRGSIGRLNRAGREQIERVFANVDQNFQALFARMFGGGRAHLALVGSEDPLAAGLELYAEPPGKRLAALGLLSGGEQALLALCLIFAVFRCRPGPIVVLDEVDAPFDEANVERFSRLLRDITRDTATRLCVITHHPLTMAAMDRLYGVTMEERGVSRLLSVDLVSGAALAASPALVA